MFSLCKNKDDKNILAPLNISKNNLKKTIADLLLHKSHYTLIKKLQAYVGNNNDQKFVCRNCLSCYGSEDSLNIEFCVLIKKLFVMYLQNKNILNGKNILKNYLFI